jgi:hypothetical protein
MRKILVSLIVAPLLTSGLIVPTRAAAQTAVCPLGYTVVYYNGVGNSYPDAVVGMHATQAAIHEAELTGNDVVDSEDVDYQVAYNTTASQGGGFINHVFHPVDTTILQDIAEVFVQRANDLDPSGKMGNDFFYMFWEWVDAPPQNYSNVLSTHGLSNNFFSNFVNAAVTTVVAKLATLFGINAPTESDYVSQELVVTAAANAGRKMLLVAHSQGNLFVNHSYTFILPTVGASRVKVVHVAPASVTVNGDWVLSAKDIVINGLRLVNGFESIPAVNINPPFTTADESGHGYSEIYLDPVLIDSLSGQTDRDILKAKFAAALNAMDQQQCKVSIAPPATIAKAGEQVTLTASLSPAANPANLLATTYKWTVSGNADGTLLDPNTGLGVLTAVTTQPTVTYQASSNAANGQNDSVNVEVDVSTANNNNSTTKDLADTQSQPAVITIGQTNGCFDQIASIMQAGSTYSLTQTGILGGLAAIKQSNYVAKGVVPYSDPPFASSANEQDVTTTYTYPTFPSSNQSSVDIGYLSPPTTTNPTSFVTYGAKETTTDAVGNSAVVNGTFSTPVANWNLMLVTAGSNATLSYAGSANSVTFNYTETWKLLGTPTITVPAGTFKTCNFQVTSTLPNSGTQTLWWLYGNAISIQEQDTDSSGNLVDNIQATALSINNVPYTGP